MQSIKRFPFILCLVVFVGSVVFAQTEKKISGPQATQHVGETATVCGYVASTRYLSSSRSKPTFLDLDKPYPDQDFTVVIWPEERAKFGEPEVKYLHKNICVTGGVTLYRDSPEIIARSTSQIKEQ
jgi:DNA/RNA endonuclease YhcR with UshA esterase domain